MEDLSTQPVDVCRGVWLARNRQLRDLEELPKRGYQWRPEAGQFVVDFLQRSLYHWQGPLAGRALVLEPWQCDDWILPLYSWYRPDGTRRFRQAYIEIPRKNGKTFLSAGLSLYMLMADGEQGGEVYSVATKKEQARRSWLDAANSLENSPFLKGSLKRFHSTITDAGTSSSFSPLSSESGTQDGLNCSFAVCDELHEWKDTGLLPKIQTSMVSRRQPLCLMITTAGVWDTSSVAWKQHSYAKKVLEKSIKDDGFFAYIASADKDDLLSSPATWAKANPNLGVTITKEALAEEWHRRKASGSPDQFARYHCNRWVRASEQRAVSLELWDSNTGQEPEPLGPAFVGIYVAAERELNAISLFFPDTRSVITRFFCPAETADSPERRSLYGQWAEDGDLIVTPGFSVDSRTIAAEVIALAGRYRLLTIATDRVNAHNLIERLQRELGDTIPVWRVSPSMAAMNAGTKELLSLIQSGTLRVGSNPILRYQVSQLAIKTDEAGSKAPDRRGSGDNISGPVALILALDAKLRRWSRDAGSRKPEAEPSVYEERGPLFFQM